MRNVLIVSPYYPPGPTACAHRARFLAKYLPQHGWRPVVLCVHEDCLEERLDTGLLALSAHDAEIVRCRAIPAKFARPFGLGEVTLRAWWQMRDRLVRLLGSRRFDMALFTGSHFYSMLHAPLVRQRFRVPVVLDFQDPWVSAWGATLPRWSKGGVAHRLSEWLEPKAVRAADFITSVSDTQNAQLVARYPWLDASRMAALPIGGDPTDYGVLRAGAPPLSTFALDASRINFSYVGTIWPPVLDTLRTVLIAAAEVRSHRPDIYARLRLNFIGTTSNPNAIDGSWVGPIAKDVGVADIVREEPRRLPYLEALALQAHSDVILILGSDEPHYTASKIYGAMMSGRPFLSVFHKRSSSHEILSRSGGGITLSFSSAVELEELTPAIGDAVVRLATAPQSLGHADPSAYEPFTARAIARSYAKIFESLRPSASSRTVS